MELESIQTLYFLIYDHNILTICKIETPPYYSVKSCATLKIGSFHTKSTTSFLMSLLVASKAVSKCKIHRKSTDSSNRD